MAREGQGVNCLIISIYFLSNFDLTFKIFIPPPSGAATTHLWVGAAPDLNLSNNCLYLLKSSYLSSLSLHTLVRAFCVRECMYLSCSKNMLKIIHMTEHLLKVCRIVVKFQPYNSICQNSKP